MKLEDKQLVKSLKAFFLLQNIRVRNLQKAHCWNKDRKNIFVAIPTLTFELVFFASACTFMHKKEMKGGH